ncbi:PREDICTED: sphingosine-1-phosphate phosphatase 1 [Dipodomys ordii]|uniref:Sphingosine-1-phosphate phosphatase 1 n=1 Tax=Dipodomys ordii TaxID=10020 RepID=A0A1S3F0I5_DIPOR|nr:PREDICTED: sphingosine-1-phosphate phosphatase 1 [Dipodomys ordii]
MHLGHEYPLMYGLILIPCWCSLVCISRIYMGMHSILDIIAGFLYTILILAVFYPFVDLIDNFNQTHKYAPLIIIGLHLALGIFSFTLDTWSTSRGDTAEILGSGAGIACGSHVSHSMGLMLDPPLDILPLARPPITVMLLGKAILRVLIGMVFVLVVRDIMKKTTIPLACKVFNIPCDDIRKARQHMEVELPYRYITYGMVGFSITFFIPYIFFFIGIS